MDNFNRRGVVVKVPIGPTSRVIPVRKVYARLKVFSNSDLELIANDGFSKTIRKSRGRVIFDFK